ncbi:unnamed protein product [Protopolystoma xenopodis]|uniref:ATPase AAA-type core domain-containing protein n=1 Tax=Protopolystoma xenopodis TaxID=117903 RepID=A0A3S5AFC8_9PLAT|nr:unnamed protein product [Protopolystoma xenopodis]
MRKEFIVFLKFHLFPKEYASKVWPTLLVSGPPFCGKTTLIEATCGECAPCVIHLDDIESMEKHSIPVGSFRATCALKSYFLKDCMNSAIVVIGETRSLQASLPSSISDLFTERITFGMMDELLRTK